MKLELAIKRDEKTFKIQAKSPLGKGSGTFELDPSLNSKIKQIENAIDKQDILDEEFVEEFGIQLFEMLFSDIKDLLYTCLEQCNHLTIVLNTKDPDIQVIPWELCYDPEKNIFLAADPDCTLVRRDNKSEEGLTEIDYPLKVLVIVSSPMDLDEKGDYQPDPDEIMEFMNPLTELQEKGMVVLDCVERASIREIQDSLHKGYHIIHFVGHGSYNAETGEGSLLIEDKKRNSKKLDGRDVSRLFGTNPPQLMILTACESAPLIPFLLTRKIPAVMAMQYTVLADIAHEFVERFYSSLVRGTSIREAVSNARNYILLEEGTGHPGWFTPVLYTRADTILEINTKSAPVIPVKEEVTRFDMTKDLPGAEQFVGRRKDLWSIEKALFEDNYKMVAITGMGGIGKSALASKFEKRHRSTFKGVFAKKVDSSMGVEAVLAWLDQFLIKNDEDRLHQVLGEPLDLQLEVLNQCLKEGYLLILDNFEVLLEDSLIKDKGLEKLLQAVLGGDHKSKVIITSRYEFMFADKKTSGLTFVDLDELSFQFARKIMERDITDFEMQIRVYEKIGGNPQFLTFFARLSRTKSCAKLLEDIALVREKVGDWLLNELVELLSEEEKMVLRKFSAFRRPVREEGVFTVGGSDIMVQRLVYYSLVRVERNDHDVYYFMHPMVREYCYDLLCDNERITAHSEAAKYYEMVIDKKQGDLLDIFELHHHFFESEQYERAGNLVSSIFEPLYMRGFRKELMGLLADTVKTTKGKTKASGFFNLGKVMDALGEYEGAEKCYKKSLEIAKSLGNKYGIAALLHQLGILQERQGNYEKAEKYYKESLEIKENLGDKQGIAISLHQLGMIQGYQGNYEKAEKYCKDSLEIKESLGDKEGIAISLQQLGILQGYQGNYEKAEKYCKDSLEILERLGDKYGITASLHNLGNIQYFQGNYEKAEKYYKDSLEIKESLGDKQGIAISLHQLGMLQKDQGNYEKAEKYYKDSLEIRKSLGDKYGIAASLHQLGILQERQGNYEKAEKYYKDSLEIMESLGNKYGIAASLHQLGSINERKENYEKAVEYYIKSLSITLELRVPETKMIIVSLQRMRYTMGENRFDSHWKAITNQDVPDFIKIPKN